MCKNPFVKVTAALSAGVAAKFLSKFNVKDVPPLLVTACIVYSVALPAIVKLSLIAGAVENPSIVTEAPDCPAPCLKVYLFD